MAEVTDRIVAPTIPRRRRSVPAGRSELRQQRSVDTHPRPVMPEKTVGSAEAGASKISLDRPLHAAVARFTLGISPAALSQAYIDWLQHIVNAEDLHEDAMRKVLRGYAKDKNDNLILIGAIAVPMGKDKCSPAARREKRHLVRQGATICKKETIH